MNGSRKPRSDAKLLSLPIEQQEQIAGWLTLDNRSYDEVRSMVATEFGVKISAGALHHFYVNFASPWKYTRAKGEADAFASLMEGHFDEATTKRIKQLAFEAIASPTPDLKSAKTLLKMVGDSAKVSIAREKLTLDSRKVALLEAKAAQADSAKGIADNPELTDAEKGARLRSLFGMG